MNGLSVMQDYLKKEQFALMIIQSMENLHYFAGFTGTTGLALILQDKAYFISDSRYTEQAQKQCEGYEVIQYTKTALAEVQSLIEKHFGDKGVTIGFEGNKQTVDAFNLMLTVLGKGHDYKSCKLEGLRAVKRDDELDCMRKAATIADEAFAVVLTQLKPGMTENDARILLECEMLKRGSEGISFTTIVASGYRSSMPHGVASDKVMEEGDFVTFDFGAVYGGYHSDMTRTIVLGKASDRQKELYYTLLDAQELGLAHVKAGISGKELDAIVRNRLTEKGYGQYFGHGLGHGVGLDIHELPVTSPMSTCTLQTNMVVTVEPGIYFAGDCGLRIEDSVIVTDDGFEFLTHTTKELLEICND